MELVEQIIRNSEPQWLENTVYGSLRVWHVMFICFAGVLTIVIILCCCIRFRIPRTKQQIEADHQRRKITTKFRQRLEKIQDAKMDTISLKDALELLYGEIKTEMGQNGLQDFAEHIQRDTPQQGEDGKQRPEPQAKFAKLATKVSHARAFILPMSPTSNVSMTFPTSGTSKEIDF